MPQTIMRAIVIAIIALCLGIAGTTAAVALIPDTGSPPSIFDDFNWDSTANHFWHVNAIGATAKIRHGMLTLAGNSVELDRRFQTDPNETIVATHVRGIKFHKFGFGAGLWHAGTIGMEFDDDGVKCGRASDFGYKVDYMRDWTRPPVGQWFYLEIALKNPYPDPKKIPPNVKDTKLKRVVLRCSIYDQAGKLVATTIAKDPPPNTHYVGLDEAYVRTWDNHNQYQVDWVYAGPPSGNPVVGLVQHHVGL